jgi:hypothetical protein
MAVGKRAANLEAIAEVAGARYDHQFQGVAGFDIAEHGILVGKPAHGDLLFARLIPRYIVVVAVNRVTDTSGISRVLPIRQTIGTDIDCGARRNRPGGWEDRCYLPSNPAWRVRLLMVP